MNQLLEDSGRFSVTAFGCSFTVWGKPEPGGSKKVLPRGRKFPITIQNFRQLLSMIVVVDDNDKAKGWKDQIEMVTGVLMKGREPFSGPLVLEVVFNIERPKGHLNTRLQPKPSAPKYPTKKPDATKLLRPVEDAMTGIVWLDDAQIVDQHVKKRYAPVGEGPSMFVSVRVL